MPKKYGTLLDFRKMSIEYDGLDPSNYVSLLSYSWDAILKMTEKKPNMKEYLWPVKDTSKPIILK
ncbi:2227_t:CDS:2 [Funneliformis geosporum]|uniref:2227_t:CDS:1 n=1 Tax=Funneliformis geosporum TaxID=1117311 RepID=A0A9W4SKD6_9GLOM|nr:2227_t:CDS:2 [Funneliformis geosporum]